ncbi:MAG: FumA C-terminus/TtdB family hydratase beta subunit [Coriobacteriales bacterium]
MAGDQIRIQLPAGKEALGSLRAGDRVLLSGPVFTMRDAGHMRAVSYLDEHGELPFGLAGQTLFYAGPTPASAGRPHGAIGPTTASRMDFATPRLFGAGIAATIGKGKRGASVKEACREFGCVHFTAVGGVAALLASCVVSSDPVAWPELGTEALVRLELVDFPAFVGIDALGTDIFDSIGCEVS